MLKIRDLGVNDVLLAANDPCGTATFVTCSKPDKPGPNCAQTPPQCIPTNKPKNAAGLPQQAIVELKQQLQNQISG